MSGRYSNSSQYHGSYRWWRSCCCMPSPEAVNSLLVSLLFLLILPLSPFLCCFKCKDAKLQRYKMQRCKKCISAKCISAKMHKCNSAYKASHLSPEALNYFLVSLVFFQNFSSLDPTSDSCLCCFKCRYAKLQRYKMQRCRSA